MKDFLGNGSVEVTLSMTETAGIEGIRVDADTDETVYDINDRIVNGRPLAPGIYIINRNKIIIR